MRPAGALYSQLDSHKMKLALSIALAFLMLPALELLAAAVIGTGALLAQVGYRHRKDILGVALIVTVSLMSFVIVAHGR